MIFVRPGKILQMFFGKIKNFQALNLKLVKNEGSGFTFLKI